MITQRSFFVIFLLFLPKLGHAGFKSKAHPKKRKVGCHLSKKAKDSGLSKQALQKLARAQNSKHYDIQILQKSDATGLSKNVVLFGERHQKFETESVLGKEVLEHFYFRGVEGLNLEKGATAKIMSLTLSVVEKLSPLVLGTTHQSTIHDAIINTRINQKIDRLIMEGVDDLPGEEIMKKKITFSYGRQKITVSGKKLLTLIKKRAPKANKKSAPIRLIQLEANHQSTKLYTIGELMIPLKLTIPVLLGASIVTSNFLGSNELLNSIQNGLWLGVGYIGLELLALELKTPSSTQKWPSYIFPSRELLRSRNQTMAEEITKSVPEIPESGMINIVGALHVPGIKNHLLKSGFSEIPLFR